MGALLTFGAKASLLDQLGWFARICYVINAFFGIALLALFITVIANVYMRDR